MSNTVGEKKTAGTKSTAKSTTKKTTGTKKKTTAGAKKTTSTKKTTSGMSSRRKTAAASTRTGSGTRKTTSTSKKKSTAAKSQSTGRRRQGEQQSLSGRWSSSGLLIGMLVLAILMIAATSSNSVSASGIFQGGTAEFAAASQAATVREVTIPLYLQADSRWGQTPYGSSVLAKTGCGPTCLSMIAVGMTGNVSYTPDKVATWAQASGYYVAGQGSSWKLMTEGAEQFGLHAESVPMDEGSLRSQLEQGHPIICSMTPGDFTAEGHFIVLRGVGSDGILVNDPNSADNSSHGWQAQTLLSQMAGMWAYSLQ